jgi:hypothetical protein
MFVGIGMAALAFGCSSADTGSNADSMVGKAESALTGNIQILGRVTTPTGFPISGVTMVLAGLTSKSVTTDATGRYTIPGIAAGSYTVTPVKTGLKFCS